jgi:hypothetical protein
VDIKVFKYCVILPPNYSIRQLRYPPPYFYPLYRKYYVAIISYTTTKQRRNAQTLGIPL